MTGLFIVVVILLMLSDYVSPVCLPFPEMMPEEVKIEPEVAGWGATDILARRFYLRELLLITLFYYFEVL